MSIVNHVEDQRWHKSKLLFIDIECIFHCDVAHERNLYFLKCLNPIKLRSRFKRQNERHVEETKIEIVEGKLISYLQKPHELNFKFHRVSLRSRLCMGHWNRNWRNEENCSKKNCPKTIVKDFLRPNETSKYVLLLLRSSGWFSCLARCPDHNLPSLWLVNASQARWNGKHEVCISEISCGRRKL